MSFKDMKKPAKPLQYCFVAYRIRVRKTFPSGLTTWVLSRFHMLEESVRDMK